MKVLYTLTSSYKSFLSSGECIIPFPLKHTSLAKVSPVLPYQVKFSYYGPTLVPLFCFSQLFITVVILCLFVGISDQHPTPPLDDKPLKGRDNLSFSPTQPMHSTMPKRDRESIKSMEYMKQQRNSAELCLEKVGTRHR